jgi:hypothetical protein
VASKSPQCECSCSADYLPPQCNYRSWENVTVEVWYNYTTSFFVSARAVKQLNAGLGNNASCRFVLADSGNFDTTKAVFEMLGGHAYNLRAFIASNASWTTAAHILATYDQYTRVDDAPESNAAPIEIYRQGNIVITAEGVGYLAAAVLTVLILLFLEVCCCGGYNTEEEIGRDYATGKWDLYLGDAKHKVFKYEAPPSEDGATPSSPNRPMSPTH